MWVTKQLLVLSNFHSREKIQSVIGYQKLFGYPHSSKHLFLCSAEERNDYRFGITCGCVNDDKIFIFGWTIPLSQTVHWEQPKCFSASKLHAFIISYRTDPLITFPFSPTSRELLDVWNSAGLAHAVLKARDLETPLLWKQRRQNAITRKWASLILLMKLISL